MKSVIGRICGGKHSSPKAPNSPLRGAGRKPLTVGDVGDMDESHVRFQDSDLGRTLSENYGNLLPFENLKAIKLFKK